MPRLAARSDSRPPSSGAGASAPAAVPRPDLARFYSVWLHDGREDILEIQFARQSVLEGLGLARRLWFYDLESESLRRPGEAPPSGELQAGGSERRAVLPLPGASCDAVVLHGTFDHMPRPGGGQPLRDPRRPLLEAAQRVLRPDGVLLLAANNRLYPRFDELQEGEAGGLPPLSLWGYRRLLRQAGFTRLTSYNVIRHYDEPDQLVSTEPLPSRAFYRQFYAGSGNGSPLRRATIRLINLINAMRYLERAFFFVAEK